jgi:thioredoxin 1
MSNNVNEINESNFVKKISKGVVLVDFFAEWCGPCRMLSPIIDEIAEEMQGKVMFYKVDIDKETHLASDHQVASIPTLLIFKNGKEVHRIVGLRDADAIKKLLDEAING